MNHGDENRGLRSGSRRWIGLLALAGMLSPADMALGHFEALAVVSPAAKWVQLDDKPASNVELRALTDGRFAVLSQDTDTDHWRLQTVDGVKVGVAQDLGLTDPLWMTPLPRGDLLLTWLDAPRKGPGSVYYATASGAPSRRTAPRLWAHEVEDMSYETDVLRAYTSTGVVPEWKRAFEGLLVDSERKVPSRVGVGVDLEGDFRRRGLETCDGVALDPSDYDISTEHIEHVACLSGQWVLIQSQPKGFRRATLTPRLTATEHSIFEEDIAWVELQLDAPFVTEHIFVFREKLYGLVRYDDPERRLVLHPLWHPSDAHTRVLLTGAGTVDIDSCTVTKDGLACGAQYAPVPTQQTLPMALLVTLDPKTVRPKQAAPSPMLKAPRMGPPPGVPRPDWSFSARRTWLTLSAPARKAYCKNAGAERLNVCKAMSRASDEGSPPVAFLDLPNPPGQNMEVSPAPPIDLRALESRLRLTVTVDGLRVTLKRPNTASEWAIESTNWHEALWHLHGCRGLSSWCLRNTPDGPPGDPVETLATALREYCTRPGGVPTKTCAWLGQSLLIDGMPKSAHRSKNDCRYLPTACRETNAEEGDESEDHSNVRCSAAPYEATVGATRASLPIIPFRPFTRREPVVLYQPGLLRIGFEYDAPSKRWHVTKLEDLSLGNDDAMVAKLTKAVGEHCGPVPPKYDPDDFENTPSEGVCHFFWQRCMQLGEESGTPAWWTGETKVVLTKNLGWCAIYDLHFSRSKEGRWTLDRVEQVEACRGA